MKVGAPELEGKRACLDGARAYLAAAKHTEAEKKVVAAAVTNAVWTSDRLDAAGYEVPDMLCQKCLLYNDTLHHRLWICPHGDAVCARGKAAETSIQKRAVDAGPGSALFQHAIIEHPAEYFPKVGTEVVQWCTGDGVVHQRGLKGMVAPPKMHGSVFIDGHCSRSIFDGMDRAAWSIVLMSNEGLVVSWIRGTLAKEYDQTPQAAEFVAAMYAAELCGGGSTVYCDCENVVAQFKRPAEAWGQDEAAYAGVMRIAARWREAEQWDEFVKVKAHVDTTRGDLSEKEKWLATGNDRADHHAKEAGKLHEQPSEVARKKLEEQTKDAEATLRVMASVLPLWPYAEDHQRRNAEEHDQDVPPPPKKTRVPLEDRHRWVKGPCAWHCHTCRAWSTKPVISPKRASEACKGLKDRLAQESAAELGHSIVEFTTQSGALSICIHCGRWAMRRPIGLAKACTGCTQTRRSAQAWKRVFTHGRHPRTNLAFKHADGPRGRAHGVKLRGCMERELIRRRLRGKNTPWAAALSGINGGTTQDYEEHVFQECLDEDPFQDCFEAFDFEEETVIEMVTITEEQRQRIATKKAAALQRKLAREELKRSNQAKAIATKRRKIELNGQDRLREFAEYRRVHDPYYSDDEEEHTRARGTAPPPQAYSGEGDSPPTAGQFDESAMSGQESWATSGQVGTGAQSETEEGTGALQLGTGAQVDGRDSMQSLCTVSDDQGVCV